MAKNDRSCSSDHGPTTFHDNNDIMSKNTIFSVVYKKSTVQKKYRTKKVAKNL